MKQATLIAGLIVVSACGTAAVTGGSSPTPMASDLARSQDVLTYRGDSARSGTMSGPGPAPSRSVAIAWEFQAGGPITSSPAVVDRTVFVVSGDGVVHALELSTGHERWTTRLGAEAGASVTVTVAGDIVVGDTAGKLHGLKKSDGTEHWALQADGPITGAVASAGHLVVAATTSGSAYAVDAMSGELIWRTGLPGGVSRSIAATGDAAYFGVAGGFLVAVNLADGTTLWQMRLAHDGEGGTPTVAGDLVFAATGISSADLSAKGVAAVDASSGEIRWRYASPTQAQVFTPAVVGGRAYVVGQDAVLLALDAETGKSQWTATTNGPISALPSIADGLVYVATNAGAVYAFDSRAGELVWQADVIRGQPYAPVVTGGYVLVGTSHGVLFAIGGPADE